jgi:Fe-S-cluster-containing dehydrogenase component
VQYGFFIDQSRCIGCNACTIACMQWHDILPGSVRWMRVHQWEKGVFPNVRLHMLPVMCYHCENPVCAKSCPHGAIQKEEKYGAVLVKPDRCQGSRKCWQVCPYGAPQFEGDGPGKKMSKCTMCIDRLEQGLKPICVLSCSMRTCRERLHSPQLSSSLPIRRDRLSPGTMSAPSPCGQKGKARMESLCPTSSRPVLRSRPRRMRLWAVTGWCSNRGMQRSSPITRPMTSRAGCPGAMGGPQRERKQRWRSAKRGRLTFQHFDKRRRHGL